MFRVQGFRVKGQASDSNKVYILSLAEISSPPRRELVPQDHKWCEIRTTNKGISAAARIATQTGEFHKAMGILTTVTAAPKSLEHLKAPCRDLLTDVPYGIFACFALEVLNSCLNNLV